MSTSPNSEYSKNMKYPENGHSNDKDAAIDTLFDAMDVSGFFLSIFFFYSCALSNFLQDPSQVNRDGVLDRVEFDALINDTPNGSSERHPNGNPSPTLPAGSNKIPLSEELPLNELPPAEEWVQGILQQGDRHMTYFLCHDFLGRLPSHLHVPVSKEWATDRERDAHFP